MDMSHKKLKPDVNQLPLTKFVKSNTNLEIKQSDSEEEDLNIKDLKAATDEIVSKKRKNLCEGNSPKEKISPPYKKVIPSKDQGKTFNMSDEEYKKMENNLHTKLTASLTTSLSETPFYKLEGQPKGRHEKHDRFKPCRSYRNYE